VAVELGTWYWLDAGQPQEWEADVRDMRQLGYDYVVLGWGSWIVAIGDRIEETRRMLDYCERHGLAAYLCIWSGMAMFPHLGGEVNRQIDNRGVARDYYNLWDAGWRAGAYRDYLARIAQAYRGSPALRGYLFDDTFASYSSDPRAGKYTSYAPGDAERFRAYLRAKYRTVAVINLFWGKDRYASWSAIEPPREPSQDFWLEWFEARAGWFEDWAHETHETLRGLDPQRELYLLDGGGIAANLREWYGVDLGRLTRYFDTVMLYAMPSGFDQPRVEMAPILEAVDFMVGVTKGLAPGKSIAFDFHVYQPFGADFDQPSTWPYPDLEQIGQLSRQAIRSGADKVEHYAFRTGNWRIKDRRPGKPLPEVKTMLRYRRDLWPGLCELNRELHGR